MLLDLLPHFARLLPVADKYLTGRTASDKAHETLAEEIRGKLGELTEAQAGLGRQLQQQDAHIADIGVEVTRARMATESMESRVAKLEQTAGKTMRTAIAALILMFVAVSMLAVVLMDLKTR